MSLGITHFVVTVVPVFLTNIIMDIVDHRPLSFPFFWRGFWGKDISMFNYTKLHILHNTTFLLIMLSITAILSSIYFIVSANSNNYSKGFLYYSIIFFVFVSLTVFVHLKMDG